MVSLRLPAPARAVNESPKAGIQSAKADFAPS